MSKNALIWIGLAALAGCGFGPVSPSTAQGDESIAIEVLTPDADTIRPLPRPGDETNATGPATAPGRTILSLGDPGLPGLWVETPTVAQDRPGTVTVNATGKSASVTLRPGPEGGARASLQTMLALGLSPAALAEVVLTRK